MTLQEQAQHMNRTLKSEMHDTTVFYVKRANKWTGKRVYMIEAGSAEIQSFDFDEFQAPAEAKKISAKSFDNEHAERTTYTIAVRRYMETYAQFS